MDDEKLYQRLRDAYLPRAIIERRERNRQTMSMDAWNEYQTAQNEANSLLTAAQVLIGEEAWFRLYAEGDRAYAEWVADGEH